MCSAPCCCEIYWFGSVYRERIYEITVLNNLTGPKITAVRLKGLRGVRIMRKSSNPLAPNQTSEPAMWSTVASHNTPCRNYVRTLEEHHVGLFMVAQLLSSIWGFQILLSLHSFLLGNWPYLEDTESKRRNDTVIQVCAPLFLISASSLKFIFWLCRVIWRVKKPTDHSYWATSCFSGRI